MIEIMVAVGLIGVLLALAGPRIWSAVTNVNRHKGVADVKAISDALEQYMAENQKYPDNDVQNRLRTEYLEASFTFGNAFDQSYIYLVADNNRSYVVIDLNKDTTDADPDTAGQQVEITCGAETETFTVSVENANTPADLLVAEVENDNIDQCVLSPNWNTAQS